MKKIVLGFICLLVLIFIAACSSQPAANPQPTQGASAAPTTAGASSPTATTASAAAASPTGGSASGVTPTSGSAAGNIAKPGQKPVLASTLPKGDATHGRELFMGSQYGCNRCHPNGNRGTGPSIKGVSADRIATQVRNGYGDMPAFPKDTMSDQDLADIIAYVTSLK